MGSCRINVLVLAVTLALVGLTPAQAQVSKVSELMGRVVVTADGELLGRIEDFALDIEARRLQFVVVSVGSFLIDDNMVAVHPDALSSSADGQYLVIDTDDLARARRFSDSNWPAAPDVMARAGSGTGDADTQATGPADDAQPSSAAEGRVATISDGRRTATMKAGDREAQIQTTTVASDSGMAANELSPKKYQVLGAQPQVALDPQFQRLDSNGDGYLSRREIGPVLGMDDAYTDFDVDGNDGIDAFEFQIFKDRD